MKVSICIPTYREPVLLRRCLESVFEQDFTDYEIVITDDTPDDEVRELLTSYDDKRIRYFQNKPSLGSPINWNRGFELAEGEYLKIMHHDDWFSSPQSLSHFVNLLEENEIADIAFAGSCDIRSNGKRRYHVAKKKTLTKIRRQPLLLLVANRLGAPSVMIFRNKKELFFDENLRWLVDVDFYCRAIRENLNFAYLDQVLVYIGTGDHQTTAGFNKDFKPAIEELFYVAEKFDLNTNYSKKYREKVVKVLGREGILSNESIKENFTKGKFNFTQREKVMAFLYHFMHKPK